MRRLTTTLALAAICVLTLAILPTTPSALALIPCADCSPYDWPGEVCIGNCNGVGTRTCGEYIAAGCGSLTDPQGEPKEAFLAALRQQADEPAQTISEEPHQETH